MLNRCCIYMWKLCTNFQLFSRGCFRYVCCWCARCTFTMVQFNLLKSLQNSCAIKEAFRLFSTNKNANQFFFVTKEIFDYNLQCISRYWKNVCTTLRYNLITAFRSKWVRPPSLRMLHRFTLLMDCSALNVSNPSNHLWLIQLIEAHTTSIRMNLCQFLWSIAVRLPDALLCACIATIFVHKPQQQLYKLFGHRPSIYINKYWIVISGVCEYGTLCACVPCRGHFVKIHALTYKSFWFVEFIDWYVRLGSR